MDIRSVALPFAAFLAALAVHAIIWRIRLPRSRAAALIAVFAVTPAVSYGALALRGLPCGTALGAAELAAAGLLYAALSAAYIMSYPAFEAISPTLAIALMLGRSGGLTKEELSRSIGGELLGPRIKDLSDSGLITISNGSYGLTAKGRLLSGFFTGFRAFLGLPEGDG